MDPCFDDATAMAEHERLHDHYNTNDNQQCPACLQRDTETCPPAVVFATASTKPHSSLTIRRLGTVLLLCFTLINSAYGCGPGRGLGGQRKFRKLTPLVLNQHVPNMPEKTLGASGMSEGAIQRDSPKFKKLVPNYNHDIDFVDNEGTGADRVMTQRCKEKLDILAFSVMNQWPGVLLRVIEGWDEDKHHEKDSLHYEGRAVDIITNDRDRSKYGMLARLAVEAGFDWVFYESRAHIHCSVKPDSAHISHVSGCFTSDSTVLLSTGERKAMSEVAIGDQVLSMNSAGAPIYSEVILFMDRNLELKQEFVQITTDNGAVLTVTPAHLVRVWNRDKESTTEYVFADRVEEDDYVFVQDSAGDLRPQRVVDLRAVLRKGVVAPLTAEGTIVVNSVVASCYAIVNSQKLAHWSLAPMRLMATLKHLMPSGSSSGGKIAALHGLDSVTEGTSNSVEPQNGVHWYTQMLYTIKDYVVPKSWRYQ